MLADTNQQAGRPICARVCARDVAGQAETGETQSARGDCMQQVCRGQRGYWRLSETAETNVVWLITQGSGVFRECPHLSLTQAVEPEGFGGCGVVTAAFGDVQVAGVFEGRDDGGADGSQVDGPAAGAAGRGVFAERHVADVLQERSPAS
jgi:hypothetical protein